MEAQALLTSTTGADAKNAQKQTASGSQDGEPSGIVSPRTLMTLGMERPLSTVTTDADAKGVQGHGEL